MTAEQIRAKLQKAYTDVTASQATHAQLANELLVAGAPTINGYRVSPCMVAPYTSPASTLNIMGTTISAEQAVALANYILTLWPKKAK